MSFGSVMAGAAFLKLTLDDSSLQQGLNRAQQNISDFSTQVKVMCSRINISATELAAAFTAINVPIVGAIRAFAAFDDQMRMVQAVTGATGQDFEKLTEQAKKLGRETSFTASQVASGMIALGRMGFNASEISLAIQSIMNLSRATGTDLGDAAMIAANNLRVFGLESGKMSYVSDILSVTANSSAQTLNDLGEAMKMASPHAKRAGADIVETSAALGILANMGIRGSLAGTALGKSYKRLADPTIIAYLKEYGVETLNADGSMRKMRDTLVDLAKVMKNMTDAEQIYFAEKVFDARGSLGGGTLSVNTDAIDLLNEKLKNAEGAAQRAAELMENGVGGSLRKLSSAAEGVNLAFGEMLTQAFLPLIKSASTLLLWLRDLIKANDKILGTISTTIYGFLGLGAAIKALFLIGGVIKSIFSPLSQLLAIFKLLTNAQATNAQATVEAERTKELEVQKTNARRIFLENERHYNEMQNLAHEVAMVVDSEKQKLLWKQKTFEVEKATGAEALALTRSKCAAEIAEERKKLATLKSIKNAEIANNEKYRLVYALETGSTKGFKDSPELIVAQKELAIQEKLSAKKIADTQRCAAAAGKEHASKMALAQKELVMQENLVRTKMASYASKQENVANSAVEYAASRQRLNDATVAYNKSLTQTASIQLVAKQSGIKHTIALSKLNTAMLWGAACSAKNAKAILALSISEIVAAKKVAGASGIKTAMYYAEAIAAKTAAAGTLALKFAMDLLLGLAPTVIFLALSAAIYGVYRWLTASADSAGKLADELKRVREEREKGDSEREEDKQGLARLRELSNKKDLTNEDITEAQLLAQDLTQKYGDIGIDINRDDKTISLSDDAEQIQRKEASKQAIEQLEAEQAPSIAKENALKQRQAQYQARLEKEEVKLIEAQKSLELSPTSTLAKGAVGSSQLRINSLKELMERNQKELDKLQGTRTETDILIEGHKAIVAEKPATQNGTPVKVNPADTTEFSDKMQEAESNIQAKRYEDKFDRTLDQALAYNKDVAVNFLENFVQRFSQMAQFAKSEFSKQLELAAADGTIDDDERKNLDSLQNKFTQAESFVDKYADKLRNAYIGTNEALSRSSSAVGAWSVKELQQIIGGGGTEAERTARATETIAIQAKETNKYLKSIEKKDSTLTYS